MERIKQILLFPFVVICLAIMVFLITDEDYVDTPLNIEKQ